MGESLPGAKVRLRAAEPDDAVPVGEPMHERLPVMVAYIGTDERCTYHNEAFRRGLGLAAEQIDGRPLGRLLFGTPYAGIAALIREALAGRVVHHHSRPRADAITEAYGHLVPHFNGSGDVIGAYAVFIDESSVPVVLQPADPGKGVPALYEERAEQALERRAAAERLRAAIHAGQFCLYTQSIKRLSTGEASFQGICVRQAEEEESRLPPGMYLSLTQEFGLQSELDRWVITELLAHEAARRKARETAAIYCVSLSADSIGDPEFPQFLKNELERHAIEAPIFCFEIDEADARRFRSDTRALVSQLRAMGARVMLAGFGRDNCLELLKGMRVDFLKIDGSVIFHVGRSDWALGRVRAIVRVAQGVGINTVAELVESEHIADKLRELDVDYAQGMAVSAATPLGDYQI